MNAGIGLWIDAGSICPNMTLPVLRHSSVPTVMPCSPGAVVLLLLSAHGWEEI